MESVVAAGVARERQGLQGLWAEPVQLARLVLQAPSDPLELKGLRESQAQQVGQLAYKEQPEPAERQALKV